MVCCSAWNSFLSLSRKEMVRVFRERCTSTCKALWEVPSADAFLVKFLDYLLELSQLLQRLFFLENSSADHSSSPMEERLLAFEFLLSRGPDEWVQWLLLKGMQSSSVGTEDQRSFCESFILFRSRYSLFSLLLLVLIVVDT